MSGIDISTHQLAELTFQAVRSHGKSVKINLTLEDILTVWYSIGSLVKIQLNQRKGVKMSQLGTYSLSTNGDPVFIISGELANQFKLKQRSQSVSDKVPTAFINFMQVSSNCNLPRDLVEKIYTKFVEAIWKCISEGRKVIVTIQRVGEILVYNGELVHIFMNEFLSSYRVAADVPAAGKNGGINGSVFKALSSKTAADLTNDQIYMNKIKNQQYRDDNDQLGLQIGYRGNEKLKPNKTVSMVRNPITGVSPRPNSSGRQRPSSASSTNSLMYSPRPNTSSMQRNNAGGGGLRREQLEQFNRNNNNNNQGRSNPIDARLMAAKAMDVGDVIQRVREKIIERGGSNGIRSIAKLMAIMDDNGDKKLSKEELKYGLRDYGIDLSPTELEQVFYYFDRDHNGSIDVTEFLVGIRGDMNTRRKKMVRMAFNILDKDGSGTITIDEVMNVYNFTHHPEVRSGKKTIDEAAHEFMNQWDRIDKDGIISVEEFEEYYKDVSASIDDDDYFELMIRNAWRISGGQGMAANTANRRVLVTNKDGSQSVQTINDELGMNAKDMNDVRGRLARQGVNADKIDLYSGMDSTDKAQKLGRKPPTLQDRFSNNNKGVKIDMGDQYMPPNDRRERNGYRSSPRPGMGDQSMPPNDDRRERNGYRNGGAMREAWGSPRPGMGDQSLPPDDYYEERGNKRQSNSKNPKFDEFEVLKTLLYNPPVPLETLCAKLQVSSVSAAPRIAMGAFMQRISTLDSQLEKDQIKSIWKVLDTKNVGSVEVSLIHDLLVSRFGKDKNSSKNSGVIERVIKKILERCGETGGIKGLQRTIAIMDDNGDKRLTKDELKYGLADYGIELNIREIDDVFSYFDRDRSGFIDVDEFLIGIRGDLNPRRKKLVRMAFDILDTDRSGIITLDEMLAVYDVSHNPQVQSGQKTKDQAMREFMHQWDLDGDGTVTVEEFEEYYKGVSASIDGDDYFELMIRNAWRISGGQGMAANTANRRVLVTNKDGSQSVQTINDELGMNAKDMNDVRGRLARQGVNADKIDLYSGMDSTDKAQKLGRKPPTPNNIVGNRNNEGSRPGMYEKHAAAAKLAAAFRGRLGRKEALQEKRKKDAEDQRRYESELEANRPKPRQISRPKGRSFSGF